MHGIGSWIEAGGWKKLVGVLVVLAIIGFRAYNSTPHNREFVSQPVEVVVNGYCAYPIEASSGAGKLKVEVSDFVGSQYQISILTKKSMDKFHAIATSGEGDTDSVPARFRRKSKRDTSVSNLALRAGEYYAVIENFGTVPMTCTLILSEYR